MFIRESCLSAEIGSAAIPDIAKDAADDASLASFSFASTSSSQEALNFE